MLINLDEIISQYFDKKKIEVYVSSRENRGHDFGCSRCYVHGVYDKKKIVKVLFAHLICKKRFTEGIKFRFADDDGNCGDLEIGISEHVVVVD